MEKGFYHESGLTLKQVTQKDYGISVLGDTQNSAAQGHGPHDLIGTALIRSLD